MSDTAVYLPEKIAGSRLTLRRPRPGDGALLWEALKEQRSLPLIGIQNEATVLLAEATNLRTLVAFYSQRQIYYYLWRNVDDLFVGQAGFDEIDWQERSASIGYWLRASVSRQGLITQAISLLCELAFETWSFSRLTMLIDHRNDRSVALARRLTFVERGEFSLPAGANGTPDKTLIFALSRDDYCGRIKHISGNVK